MCTAAIGSDSCFTVCNNSTVTYNEPLYFGKGTKLIIQDKNSEVTPPKVKVLPPSEKEICNAKKRLTLVCVVTGFYPDHITVYWELNGRNVSTGNRTDDRALRRENEPTYSITSRLRVSTRNWFNPKNTFTCLANFYNGTVNKIYEDKISGVKGDGLSKEIVRNGALLAKVFYGTLSAKSILYGLFIFVVVWKVKGSAMKRA